MHAIFLSSFLFPWTHGGKIPYSCQIPDHERERGRERERGGGIVATNDVCMYMYYTLISISIISPININFSNNKKKSIFSVCEAVDIRDALQSQQHVNYYSLCIPFTHKYISRLSQWSQLCEMVNNWEKTLATDKVSHVLAISFCFSPDPSLTTGTNRQTYTHTWVQAVLTYYIHTIHHTHVCISVNMRVASGTLSYGTIYFSHEYLFVH